jgi:3-keto-disaccharide hydrolase
VTRELGVDSAAMTLLRVLLVAAAVFPAAGQGTPPVEPGFTGLFTGTDLTGWKITGPVESFSVKDGAIVANAQGAPSHAYYDGPIGNHAFRNFELKVDVMTRKGSNGGIYVLTEYEANPANVRASGRFPSKGFEIQVNNSHTDRARTGSLYHVQDVLDESPAKDDQWFTEQIVVKGDRITVSVDGKQVVQWTQPADWDGGREGPGRRITGPGTIALQAHDPNSTVYYRNIRIKPLD